MSPARLADEVDRADDVVPVAVGEQRRHAVLAAGDEVGLDAEPQVGLLAHERAVVVEVVARAVAPQRVLPDVERRAEAVDVLGDAELLDPALGGDVAVALGVGGGEVALGRRGLDVVGAQVDVVVGQHGGTLALAEQQLGDAQVERRRHLEVLRRRRDEPHRPPAALDERGVVGRRGERRRRRSSARSSAAAAEDLRRLDGPQARAVERAHDRPSARPP